MITNGKKQEDFYMEHYDLRIIEDCLVFSYEVELPNYPKETETVCEPKKKIPSRRERQKAKRAAKTKRFFLHMLLILLAPFAILADTIFGAISFCVRAVRHCVKGSVKYIPTLGTVSCFVLLTVILNFL